MLDGFNRQVDIKVRPVQMIWGLEQHVEDVTYRSITEPRKLVERDEHLPDSDQEPEAVS
jgi:hypothetical protein